MSALLLFTYSDSTPSTVTLLHPPVLFFFFSSLLLFPCCLPWLAQTVQPHISFPAFLRGSCKSITHACLCSVFPPHQIWSPPSYATAQILHELPAVTMGTRHLSARTKLKCNSHFTTIIIIMRHSLMFLQKLLFFLFVFFFLSVHLPTSHYFLSYGCFVWFPHILSPCLSLELQRDSWPIAGVGRSRFCVVLVCVCVCVCVVPPAAAQLAGKNIGHLLFIIIISISHYKDYWLMLPNFLTTRYQHRVLTSFGF